MCRDLKKNSVYCNGASRSLEEVKQNVIFPFQRQHAHISIKKMKEAMRPGQHDHYFASTVEPLFRIAYKAR